MLFAPLAAALLFLAGCPGPEVPSNQSQMVPASRQIGEQGVGELSPPELMAAGPLFVKGAPALPGALRTIQFGMDPGSARAAVELVRDQEVPLFEQHLEGAELLGGQLTSVEGVGFTVIIRDAKVVEIDVSIPAEDARERLVELWGEGREEGADGLNSLVWDAPSGIEVSLFELDDDKSVVKFLKRAS